MSNTASKEGSFRVLARERSSIPPNAPVMSQDSPAKNLPKEMLDAIEAGRYWEPQGIGSFMVVRAGEVIGVQEMAKELRSYSKKLDISDDDILADELLGLIRAMVDRLNWVAKAGKLGAAPRGHETWPINYAPDASKGAAKWEAAKQLYQKLGCGKDAVIRRIAGQVSYENRWTELAETGVKAARLAKHKAASVDKQIKGARLTVRATVWHGHKRIEADYYLCRDGTVIAWPSWAEQSRALPDKLESNNWREFLPVVRELVRIYLIEDEKRMGEYLKAAAPHLYHEGGGWDGYIFGNSLMKKVKGALGSLASR